jgi:hypothetical protein
MTQRVGRRWSTWICPELDDRDLRVDASVARRLNPLPITTRKLSLRTACYIPSCALPRFGYTMIEIAKSVDNGACGVMRPKGSMQALCRHGSHVAYFGYGAHRVTLGNTDVEHFVDLVARVALLGCTVAKAVTRWGGATGQFCCVIAFKEGFQPAQKKATLPPTWVAHLGTACSSSHLSGALGCGWRVQ